MVLSIVIGFILGIAAATVWIVVRDWWDRRKVKDWKWEAR